MARHRGPVRAALSARQAAPAKVRIPELWRVLIGVGSRGRLSVEYADLDCRAVEACTTLALSIPGDVLLVAAQFERARQALLAITDGSKRKLQAGKGYTGLSFGRTRVWLPNKPTETLPELPVPTLDAAIIVGAERMVTDPTAQLEHVISGPIVRAGVFCERDHWSYRKARESGTRLERLDARAVVAAYADQESKRLPKNDPRAPRLMDLEDREIAPPPFLVLARKRLWLRTDKKPEELRPKQLIEANRQLGVGWHARGLAPVVQFEARALQRKYLAIKRAARMRGKRHILLLKYRRGGFTTLEQAESYARAVTCPRSYVATLAHTDDATQRIFRMVHLYHELDPEAPPTVGEPSRSRIEFANGSLFFIGTAGGRGFARGDTLQRYHGSEISRWRLGPNQFRDVEDLIASLRGATQYGEGVLETTANGVDWFCCAYRDAKEGLNDWHPAFLRWFDDPANRCAPGTFSVEEIQDTLTEEEAELSEMHGLDVGQIAFRREQRLMHRRLFPQEMPEDDETVFLSSGHCFFDPDICKALLRRIDADQQPARRHIPGGYEHVWAEPEPGVEYVVGVDTSEGLTGGDPCGIAVLRRDTGEHVASVHGIFRPHTLGQLCVEISKRYNGALLGIERQNHGHAVLEVVDALGYGRSHLEGGNLYFYAENRSGWSTDTGSRPVMLDELARAVEDGAMKIRDRLLISECMTFKLQTGGKWEADRGAHDDAVMKWAIAWQMRKVRKARPGLIVLEGNI